MNFLHITESIPFIRDILESSFLFVAKFLRNEKIKKLDEISKSTH